MRSEQGTLLVLVGAGLLCCGPQLCPISEKSCASFVAVFVSSCGFDSFTTTCAPSATCGATSCSIPVDNAQTCDATIVLRDGTTHTAHLVITAPPAVDAGTCPARCPPQPTLALTVDGADASGIVDFSSATCAASDGGSDASADVASE